MPSWWPSRQAIVIGGVLIAVGGVVWHTTGQSCRPIDAGFWFDEVTYDSGRFGGPMTREELANVVSMARAEVTGAFTGLQIAFSDRRDASHRVRVVQELRDMRFRWPFFLPAESRPVAGLGGQGAVSFSWLANGAVAYAPENANRSDLLAGIARGIGRAAVHEFTHLILPHAPIDGSKDIRSYEYGSAARREQYFGDVHWGLAWPLLEQRLRRCADGDAS